MAGPQAQAAVAPTVLDRLAKRRLLVVSGKGGVGRTTIAALLGLACAARGRRVLVTTTGHDDRLAWMLGVDRLEDEPRLAADNLYVQRLVPQVAVREYGGMVMRSAKLSGAVFDNRIVRRLLRAIPGLDDFAVVGKAWHEAIRGGTYDAVIFDGPATGHLLYTLGVPQAILNTIPSGPLTKEAQLMQRSFEDDAQVTSVLVGLPEQWPLTELGELGGSLRERLGMDVGALIVNAVWPARPEPLQPPSAAVDPDGVVAPVFETASSIGAIGRRHLEEIADWQASEAAARCAVGDAVIAVPWQWEGVSDLAGLRRLLATVEGAA